MCTMHIILCIFFYFNLFKMSCLGIPQERISTRSGKLRETIKYHLVKMATSPNLPNSDPEKGFTVSQTAEKHGWPESLLWSIIHISHFKIINYYIVFIKDIPIYD